MHLASRLHNLRRVAMRHCLPKPTHVSVLCYTDIERCNAATLTCSKCRLQMLLKLQLEALKCLCTLWPCTSKNFVTLEEHNGEQPTLESPRHLRFICWGIKAAVCHRSSLSMQMSVFLSLHVCLLQQNPHAWCHVQPQCSRRDRGN